MKRDTHSGVRCWSTSAQAKHHWESRLNALMESSIALGNVFVVTLKNPSDALALRSIKSLKILAVINPKISSRGEYMIPMLELPTNTLSPRYSRLSRLLLALAYYPNRAIRACRLPNVWAVQSWRAIKSHKVGSHVAKQPNDGTHAPRKEKL